MANELEASNIPPEFINQIEKSVEEAIQEFGHPNEITDYQKDIDFNDMLETRGTGGVKDISFAYPVLDYKNLNNYSIIKNQNNEDIAIDTWKKS